MILGLDKFHGYLTFLKRVDVPDPGESICDLQYFPVENGAGEQTILTAFRYYGIEIGSDLEVRRLDRLPLPPEELSVIEF